jgi:hypothetical protein
MQAVSSGRPPDQGHGATPGQREGPVVRQHRHPLGREPRELLTPDAATRLGQVGAPGAGLADRADPGRQPQQPAQVFVDHALVDLARLDGRDQCRTPGAGRPGHHEVEPAVRGRGGRLRREPVRHHQTAPAPLALEDPVVDRPVLGRGDAVDVVVGRHHRPRVGVLDRDLERQQVELAQRPLVHDAVDGLPVGLGLVGDQVLHAGADALRLQAGDVRRREVAGQQRVLGVGLEQPPAQRAAVQVDRRAEHDMDVLPLRLLGEQPPDLRG